MGFGLGQAVSLSRDLRDVLFNIRIPKMFYLILEFQTGVEINNGKTAKSPFPIFNVGENVTAQKTLIRKPTYIISSTLIKGKVSKRQYQGVSFN